MLKTILEALRQQTKLLGENPAAAYGAAMTALVVWFLVEDIRLGRLVIAAKDQIISAEIRHGNEKTHILINAGGYTRRAQESEERWKDSAFMWKYRYYESKQSPINSKN